MSLLGWLPVSRKRRVAPAVHNTRVWGAAAAVVFVHGFSGSLDSWEPFSKLLLADERIKDWDILRVGYPTGFRVDIPNVWRADPDLAVCARELRTALTTSPLKDYARLALVAHSMGGLVVQRAIVDDEALRGRLAHVVFYGTPSLGLGKAKAGRWLKRQFRDMSKDSPFVNALRERWDQVVGEAPRFDVLAVAGDLDQFVPPESSLSPFPDHQARVIPGDHLQIVAPDSRDHLGYTLLIDLLRGAGVAASGVSGARLAAERGEHQKVVDAMLPRAAELDDGMLQTLALSLDSLGRGPEALELLQAHLDVKKPTSNLLGILGGRVKRRWLLERRAKDLTRAQELYGEGLREAEAAGSAEQIYYHAINLAFLALLSIHPDLGVPAQARAYAETALAACANAKPSAWREATVGEARLVLGDLDAAVTAYRRAARDARSVRERESMYAQALQAAGHVFGEEGIRAIEEAFGVKPGIGAR